MLRLGSAADATPALRAEKGSAAADMPSSPQMHPLPPALPVASLRTIQV